jgi:hypothetical protein
MQERVSSSTLEFLTWISSRPRTYAEAMEAWRTTCPRHCVWEDALIDGLVEVLDSGNTMNQSAVVLSALGSKVLERKS